MTKPQDNPSPADSFMAALPAPVSSTSSGQVNISAVSLSGPTTTYTFSPITPTNLQVGSIVVVTGLQNVVIQGVPFGVNGLFAVSSVSGNTFTVSTANSPQTSGSESSQNGNGTVLAVGNPVFLVPGP